MLGCDKIALKDAGSGGQGGARGAEGAPPL